MSGIDFLDSNIFVYAVDKAAPSKQKIASQLIAQSHADQSAIISFQVVQETLHVLRRKFQTVVSMPDTIEFLRGVMAPFWRVQPSAGLYTSALQIQERLGFSFYDALIVAAALEAGCQRLISEDLQHGQKINGLVIHNPFLT
jgi:predicted nucleic acid-binding protein